ncbi:MAG TPA: AMP-binding protein, partial [Candidatus Kapabacteria bacterium]|nr:AMP-binding protein [Candidatus Kapabacteria bacterium]
MLSPDLTTKIQHARTLSKTDAQAETLPYENIGELLFKQARNYDTKPYLIYYDLQGERIEYGYKDFFMLVQQCANMMRDHGVVKGDRVVTISHNHADTVIHYFA